MHCCVGHLNAVYVCRVRLLLLLPLRTQRSSFHNPSAPRLGHRAVHLRVTAVFAAMLTFCYCVLYTVRLTHLSVSLFPAFLLFLALLLLER